MMLVGFVADVPQMAVMAAVALVEQRLEVEVAAVTEVAALSTIER